MKWIPKVESGHRLLFAAMLGCFALFGLNVTASGAALPQVIREFGWSYPATALVLCAGSFSYLIATIVSGVLIQRLGPRAVIVPGLVVQAVGLGLFGATGSVWINAALMLVSGAGTACTEVVVNFSVVQMERGGQSRLMNLMHGAFAAGAVTSPAVVWLLASLGGTWQTVFRINGGLSLVMAAMMAVMPFARMDVPAQAGPGWTRVGDVLRNPLVVLGSLILMVYVGVEIGLTDWVAEYCVVTMQADKADAAMLVSVLWLGLFAGRVGTSMLYHGTRQDRLLLGMSVTTLAAVAATLLARTPTGVAVGVFVSGLGMSAIYPVVMTMLGRHVRKGQSMALALASTGGGAGSFVFPFVIGAVASEFGIARGFAISAGLAGVMLVLVIAMAGAVKRRGEVVD